MHVLPQALPASDASLHASPPPRTHTSGNGCSSGEKDKRLGGSVDSSGAGERGADGRGEASASSSRLIAAPRDSVTHATRMRRELAADTNANAMSRDAVVSEFAGLSEFVGRDTSTHGRGVAVGGGAAGGVGAGVGMLGVMGGGRDVPGSVNDVARHLYYPSSAGPLTSLPTRGPRYPSHCRSLSFYSSRPLSVVGLFL